MFQCLSTSEIQMNIPITDPTVKQCKKDYERGKKNPTKQGKGGGKGLGKGQKTPKNTPQNQERERKKIPKPGSMGEEGGGEK